MTGPTDEVVLRPLARVAPASTVVVVLPLSDPATTSLPALTIVAPV
ncbi:MAG: hypothetical protein WCP06_11535 [Verrucomicrobiota bacterium]